MANIFKSIGKGIGRLFGLSSQKKSKIQPLTSLKEVPETRLALQTLKERLAGRGVGFRPEVISGATAPFAAQQRAGLKEVTIPTISAAASARGLGRSTIPVGQIARESGGVERDIASRVADLTLASEQQRRLEMNQALQDILGFGRAEAATKGARAGFEQGELARTVPLETAGTKRLVSLGANILGGKDLGSRAIGEAVVKSTQGDNSALVNTGTGDLQQILKIIKLLKG